MALVFLTSLSRPVIRAPVSLAQFFMTPVTLIHVYPTPLSLTPVSLASASLTPCNPETCIPKTVSRQLFLFPALSLPILYPQAPVRISLTV
jgi:hypothetical protein